VRSVFRHWPDICQVEDVRGDGERTQEQDARTAREPPQSSGAGDGGSNAVATCDACEGSHSREEVRKDVSADSDAQRIEGENHSSSAANTITYASYFRTLACLCD
jgi:hypothetical protein